MEANDEEAARAVDADEDDKDDEVGDDDTDDEDAEDDTDEEDDDEDESLFCVRIDHQRRSAISTLQTHTEASSAHHKATSGVRTGITDGDEAATSGTQ